MLALLASRTERTVSPETFIRHFASGLGRFDSQCRCKSPSMRSSVSAVIRRFRALVSMGFYFVPPYMIGLVAAVDRKGRAAVAFAGVSNFGYAAGPGLAGRIIQYMDRDWLVMIIAGSAVASMLLFLPLAIRVDRDARAARGSAAIR